MHTDTQQTSGETLAAIFPDAKSAHAALDRLHKAHFGDTWLGVVHGNPKRPDGMTLDDASAKAKAGEAVRGLATFFALTKEEDPATATRGERRSLHRTLHERGVAEADLDHIEAALVPGCAVVTIVAHGEASGVRSIVTECGGSMSGEAAPRLVTATMHDLEPDGAATPARNAMAQPGMSVAPNALNPNLDATDPIAERIGDLAPMPVNAGSASAGESGASATIPVYFEEIFVLLPDDDAIVESRPR